MRISKAIPEQSFNGFVFTATGDSIDPNKISAIDLFDNLIVEFDRLRALEELLSARQEALETEGVAGLALLLRDVEHRGRAILEAFHGSRAARPKG